MTPTVRFLRHDGVYRSMRDLFESPTRSAAFRSGPGQTFRTHRKLLRPTHRRDELRPAIPQRVARQHCPSPLHRQAHPKSVPGSGTMNLQRTVNSVLTVCLSPGDNPIATGPAEERSKWITYEFSLFEDAVKSVIGLRFKLALNKEGSALRKITAKYVKPS
jgi:hypothetical protein